MAVSEAQKRANLKWDRENKERKLYLSDRSRTKSFINKKATFEDLIELETLISEKKKEMAK